MERGESGVQTFYRSSPGRLLSWQQTIVRIVWWIRSRPARKHEGSVKTNIVHYPRSGGPGNVLSCRVDFRAYARARCMLSVPRALPACAPDSGTPDRER